MSASQPERLENIFWARNTNWVRHQNWKESLDTIVPACKGTHILTNASVAGTLKKLQSHPDLLGENYSLEHYDRPSELEFNPNLHLKKKDRVSQIRGRSQLVHRMQIKMVYFYFCNDYHL